MPRRGCRLARTCTYRGAPCVVIRSAWLRRRLFAKDDVAFAVGPYLFFRSETAWRDLEIRDHEYQHFRQHRKFGLIKGTVKYLLASLKHGYDNNPYEKSAARYAARRARERKKNKRKRPKRA